MALIISRRSSYCPNFATAPYFLDPCCLHRDAVIRLLEPHEGASAGCVNEREFRHATPALDHGISHTQ